MPQHDLHLDTLFIVMEHLGLKDGLSCMLVCKEWYQLDRFEMVWKTLLSNWAIFKINYYEELMKGFPKKSFQFKIYKSLYENIKKFHTLQILNEKKVNGRSFMEYMEKGVDDERSVIFGSRFKNLIPTALSSDFLIMMSKGLEEINADYDDSIINYSHTGAIAQYFLSNAKKFTKDGRVMEGLRAQEYWKRCSKSLLKLFISNLPTEDLVLEFMSNYKPIFDDSTLTNFIHTIRGNENLLKFIKEYISIDGNMEKSSEPSKITIPVHFVAVSSLLGLEYWFDCMEMIYPGMSETIFDYNLKEVGNTNRLCCVGVSPSFECLKRYCEIVRVQKVDLFKGHIKDYLLRNKRDYKLIREMFNHGMLDSDDIKKLLHTHTFPEANPMKLIRMLKDFDPYEVISNDHFVTSFFENVECSFSKYFRTFYNEYGPFDLEKLILILGNDEERGIDYYIDKARVIFIKRLQDHSIATQNGMSDFIDSLDVAGKCFKQHILDISIIEKVSIFLMNQITEIPFEKKYLHLINALLHTKVSANVSFEEYCQSFYMKYPSCGATLKFTTCEAKSEKRMALLYHCCQALLTC